MPSFYTFDETRFTKDWSLQLQAAMLKPTFDAHTYDDVENLNKICDLAIEEKRKGNPRAGEAPTVDNLNKSDIALLYHYSRLSEAATETLIMLILLQSIGLRAKWN